MTPSGSDSIDSDHQGLKPLATLCGPVGADGDFVRGIGTKAGSYFADVPKPKLVIELSKLGAGVANNESL